MRRLLLVALALVLAPLAASPALAQSAELDTVRAQPLDGGKMWLFEDPPTDYLQQRYGFTPDAAWYERARLAALRMPGCSASFVSPMGLMATNHHCAQGSVVQVDRGGENLLDNGFYARSQAEERQVPGLYVDQMIAIADVTDEVRAAADAAGADRTDAAIEAATTLVTARLLAAQNETSTDPETARFVVQVVPLYNGGRYSAYTFRRYHDVRLAMAPEARLGYFGGDYDNFTYPRYAADFAFFRVYDEGRPVETEHFFPLATEGVEEGSLVFVVGNPGSTSRGLTVAQLEFLRDVQLPSQLAFYDSRIATLNAYLASGDAPNPDAVRSQIFGLANAQKATEGRLRGLRDPYIIARRSAAERDFTTRSASARTLVGQQAALQARRRDMADAATAFSTLFNPRFGSATLRRARAVSMGQPTDEIASLAPMIERGYLAAELDGLRAYYGASGRTMPPALAGASSEAAADALLAASALDTATMAPMSDPAVSLVQAIMPDVDAFVAASRAQGTEATALARQIGRARFETYGASVPPDATFSLRFTDGVVTGYPYNGTEAPALTTLFGLFDRHHSYCVAGDGAGYDTEEGPGGCDWELPQRWLDAEQRLDLSTPVNFTSTSDTIGGNSGSPVVDRNLRLVGLNFDRTIEGLVRDYLYAPERGRNVMVDTRLIIEALRTVYGLPALADELTMGRP